jgi:sugar phosphate isomerase/epimerase
MDLGVMIDIWEDTEFTGAFEQAVGAGFTRGQVNVYLPEITPNEMRKLALAASQEGFHVDAMGCYINPLRLYDASLSKTGFNEWKTVVEHMVMLNGVERIVCWSGTLGRTVETPNLLNQEEETFNSLFVAVSAMLEQVRGFPLQIILEPYTAHVMYDAKICKRLTQQFPNGDVRVVLDAPAIIPYKDVGHHDTHTQDLVREIAPSAGMVHLRDLVRTDSGQRVLTRPGSGYLNYAAYLREISQHVPAVPVIVAGAKTGPEMTQSRLFLEGLLREISMR